MKNVVEIYCDGANSMKYNAGGWASVIKYRDNIIEISGALKNTTNQRMEMISCIQGLEYVKKYELENNLIEVYSDSAYLINCMIKYWWKTWIKNGWINSKKESVANRDLWEHLIFLNNGLNINFIKIKGHSGNKYNERANKLAKAEVEKIKQLNIKDVDYGLG